MAVTPTLWVIEQTEKQVSKYAIVENFIKTCPHVWSSEHCAHTTDDRRHFKTIFFLLCALQN